MLVCFVAVFFVMFFFVQVCFFERLYTVDKLYCLYAVGFVRGDDFLRPLLVFAADIQKYIAVLYLKDFFCRRLVCMALTSGREKYGYIRIISCDLLCKVIRRENG